MTNPAQITMEMMRQYLYSAVVCDALDAEGLIHQSPRIPFQCITVSRVVIGRCKTTLWADMAHTDPCPYQLELAAVDSCKPDEMIIAAAGGSLRSGIWGELLTTAARNQGCVGVLVDGAVRDVAKMRMMQFPIFARGTSPYDSKDRQRVIDMDIVVEIGGVRITPGDLIIADEDGIVVVPRQKEESVIRRAWDKVFAENKVRDEIRAGSKAAEVFQKHGVL